MSSSHNEEIMRVTYYAEACDLVTDVRRADLERLCKKMSQHEPVALGLTTYDI